MRRSSGHLHLFKHVEFVIEVAWLCEDAHRVRGSGDRQPCVCRQTQISFSVCLFQSLAALVQMKNAVRALDRCHTCDRQLNPPIRQSFMIPRNAQSAVLHKALFISSRNSGGSSLQNTASEGKYGETSWHKRRPQKTLLSSQGDPFGVFKSESLSSLPPVWQVSSGTEFRSREFGK